MEQLQDFLQGTLLFVQWQQLCVGRSLLEAVQQCVDVLKEKELITVDSHSQSLRVTKLGKATYKGTLGIPVGLLTSCHMTQGVMFNHDSENQQ